MEIIGCQETAQYEQAKSYAAAATKTPPKDAIYITVVGHPPRPDQEEFVDYLQQHLVNGCLKFKVKGVWFTVRYEDVQTGFVPPKAEAGLLKLTNRIRRSVRNNDAIPMWLKSFAKHKVNQGFAMARVTVTSDNEPEKVKEWLEYFANNSNPFPEELPYKTFRLLVSPMDLYRIVLAHQRSLKRSA